MTFSAQLYGSFTTADLANHCRKRPCVVTNVVSPLHMMEPMLELLIAPCQACAYACEIKWWRGQLWVTFREVRRDRREQAAGGADPISFFSTHPHTYCFQQ